MIDGDRDGRRLAELLPAHAGPPVRAVEAVRVLPAAVAAVSSDPAWSEAVRRPVVNGVSTAPAAVRIPAPAGAAETRRTTTAVTAPAPDGAAAAAWAAFAVRLPAPVRTGLLPSTAVAVSISAPLRAAPPRTPP